MRFLLASTGAGAIAVALAATSAHGETVITSAVTTPVLTGTANDDLRISSTGSVKPTGGVAVTINSNDSVKNEGTIAIQGANNSAGILANTNLAGNITNTGTITIDENYTPEDSDKDGDIDGTFAQGSGRFGIRVLGGGTYTGAISNSGTITIEGNQSTGIAIDSALSGSLSNSGKISVLGSDTVGIRAGAISGNVAISSGSNIAVQGQNSVGVLLGGDIGGSLVIQGTVNSTGYRYPSPPGDTSKLDADDLLQSGSAVVVARNVAGGILLDARPADSNPNDADEDDDGIADAQETTASITTVGAAPAMAIGSASQDISIGAVASSTDGHGLVVKGGISGLGVYDGINATGLSIGGTGHAANIAGGMTVSGNVRAEAAEANAAAIRIGAGASVPVINVSGAVRAEGAGVASTSAQAIVIESGATVNTIRNSGTIDATRSGEAGTATAIVDKSGGLSLVENSGTIAVVDADELGDSATAIDLRSNAAGATVRQVAAASGKPAPQINGNILFGAGNDRLDVQSGSVSGKVDFGGGSDLLTLGGTSVFRGTLSNAAGLAVNLGAGTTLDVKNLGTVDLASLTTGTGSTLGVTIGTTGHTLYNVAGAANFAGGTTILVTFDSIAAAAGTHTIIDAGTLTGAENLTTSSVTLPYLFTSNLTASASTGQVSLDVALKDADELGLNESETAILGAALQAADADRPMASVFLTAQDSESVRGTLQQMLPEHAGGVFETATKGSRLAANLLADRKPVMQGGLGVWFQEVAWGTSKSIGSTSSYDVAGLGMTGGVERTLGSIGNVGLTASFLHGKDSKGDNELVSNQYEGGIYWRGGVGPLRAYARAAAGTINFEGDRNFAATVNGQAVNRTAEGEWNGRIYSAVAGLSYELRLGRLTFRPSASIDHYKLKEKGYTETGGGDGFDLTVRGRTSNETGANALLALGYDLLSLDPEESWLRVEVEGGRREILSGSLGETRASFGDGDPFTLTPEKRTGGWRGGLRVMGGGSLLSIAAEVGAEQQQGKASIGGRVGVSLAM
jgi:hypothetical protein